MNFPARLVDQLFFMLDGLARGSAVSDKLEPAQFCEEAQQRNAVQQKRRDHPDQEQQFRPERHRP